MNRITSAGIRFHRSRQVIYEWKSLRDKIHRPHSHPAQHTQDEKNMLLRSYYSLVRVVNKWLNPEIKKSTHKSLFEQALEDMDIIYYRIRVATPRHNGKVERQHMTDEKHFYKKVKIYSLEDGPNSF